MTVELYELPGYLNYIDINLYPWQMIIMNISVLNFNILLHIISLLQ